MEFERLQHDIIGRLHKLPGDYRYHDVNHTLEVMENAVKLGVEAGLSEHEQSLLNTAALLHDYGYLECYHNNEPRGAAAAEEILPAYGYSAEDIGIIADMIRATAPVYHSSRNRLESLICDADLGYLGGDDFIARSNDLRQEYTAMEKHLSDSEWYHFELGFLNSFKFKTPEGEKLFGKGLADNIEKVRKLLEESNE